jgi:magnesium transporter
VTSPGHLEEPITPYIRRDFDAFLDTATVSDVLRSLRSRQSSGNIIYLYITDTEGRLVGVVPTRRLLTSDEHTPMRDIMIANIVKIRDSACIMDACELFMMHRFLSLPVVDSEKKIVGVLDATILSDEIIDVTEKQSADALFESIGVRIDQIKDGSPLRAFRFRFPWLTATIASGLLCALLSSFYEITLAQSIVLAFFLTLVLGLGESVSTQSMTVTIQELRNTTPNWPWFLKTWARELITGSLLGSLCGAIVGAVVMLWRQHWQEALCIGLSIALAICCAAFIGRTVPALLHALKLDPKISAGPLTLGTADLCTLAIYFNLAILLLR